ncbi:MAG TPA: hypothetical protein VGH67_03255 [Solirubrobacteraceae bacterium]|jgi:hypothetical protein
MSDDPSMDNIVDAHVVVEDPQGSAAGEEAVEGMPVLSEVRTIVTPAPVVLPAVQAAAVAATGFVAGAATLALVKRHSARKLARTRQSRRALDALPIVGSRSFLVDVHLIARDPGGNP